VNVALVPVLIALIKVSRTLGWPEAIPNLHSFLRTAAFINLGLLFFNLLPIYPLDGGQILRSLLWFFMGRGRSLMVATVIGFIGVAALIAAAIFAQSIWFAILSAFLLLNCWRGLMQARMLLRAAKVPRREGFACPVCGSAPPLGSFWLCSNCRNRFDTFETQGVCPRCGAGFNLTSCMDCGRARPIEEWKQSAPVPPTF
jgi:hypothetical protein